MTDVTSFDLNAEVLKGTLGKAGIAVVKFASAVIFARYLGPAAFGGIYLLFRISTVVIRPAIGWAKAVKKRYSEVGRVTNEVRSELFGLELLFTAGWTVLCASLAVIFGGYLDSLTGLRTAGVLLGLVLAGEVFERTLGILLTATGRVGLSIGIKFGRVLVTLPLQLFFLFIIVTGAAGVVYGLFVAMVLGIIVALRYVNVKPGIPSLSTIRSVRSFARYSIPKAVFGTFYENIDVIVLGIVLTSASAGYYEAAFRLTLPAIFLAEVASSGLMSKVSADASRDEPVGDDVTEVLSYAGILAIPLFFGTLPVADDLITVVYGASYADATSLLIGLAFYQIVLSQSKPILASLDGLNQPQIAFQLSAIAFFVNVALGVFLTLQFGPIGVVVSTILAESIRYTGGAWYVRKTASGVNLLSGPVVAQLVSGMVMATVVWQLADAVTVDSAVRLFGIVTAGVVIYTATLFLTSDRTRTIVQSRVRL
jgi:O-antigen/teichoic acid export membrane protein